ncbi:hypothetical protein GQ53DRAFT_752212 [Thozetella sp. PMI_491]|nr:hypothetical protein GQ53DRAFT_752212 [Thozetella sp. PMI_491]
MVAPAAVGRGEGGLLLLPLRAAGCEASQQCLCVPTLDPIAPPDSAPFSSPDSQADAWQPGRNRLLCHARKLPKAPTAKYLTGREEKEERGRDR